MPKVDEDKYGSPERANISVKEVIPESGIDQSQRGLMVSEKNSPSKVEAEVSVSVDSLDRESESEESDEQFNSEHSRSVNMPRVKLG